VDSKKRETAHCVNFCNLLLLLILDILLSSLFFTDS